MRIINIVLLLLATHTTNNSIDIHCKGIVNYLEENLHLNFALSIK